MEESFSLLDYTLLWRSPSHWATLSYGGVLHIIGLYFVMEASFSLLGTLCYGGVLLIVGLHLAMEESFSLFGYT